MSVQRLINLLCKFIIYCLSRSTEFLVSLYRKIKICYPLALFVRRKHAWVSGKNITNQYRKQNHYIYSSYMIPEVNRPHPSPTKSDVKSSPKF